MRIKRPIEGQKQNAAGTAPSDFQKELEQSKQDFQTIPTKAGIEVSIQKQDRV
jgi:hypothetical protein